MIQFGKRGYTSFIAQWMKTYSAPDRQYCYARILNSGLQQGSVLVPLLFNLYASDMPETRSRKFG